MVDERTCTVCVRRARERGGNDSCPLHVRMRGEFERGVRDCRYFLLGDRRLAHEVAASEARLF